MADSCQAAEGIAMHCKTIQRYHAQVGRWLFGSVQQNDTFCYVKKQPDICPVP
jgi:hypothetical protein